MNRPDYNETIAIVNLILTAHPVTEIRSITACSGQADIVAFNGDEMLHLHASIDYEDLDADWSLE